MVKHEAARPRADKAAHKVIGVDEDERSGFLANWQFSKDEVFEVTSEPAIRERPT
jgi:hypothetical protein